MELNDDKRIPFDIHYKHHAWTDKQMLRDDELDAWTKQQIVNKAKRDAFVSDVYKHVVKVGVLVVLGWVLSLIVLGGEVQLTEVVKEVLVEKVIKND